MLYKVPKHWIGDEGHEQYSRRALFSPVAAAAAAAAASASEAAAAAVEKWGATTTRIARDDDDRDARGVRQGAEI